MARSGTEAIANGLAWSVSSTTPFECTYSFNAINDPDPTGDTSLRTFWEAINLYLEDSEQLQTVIRAFFVERARGLSETPGTTVATIKEVFPSISAYLSDEEIGDHIAIAEEQMQLELMALNVRWLNVVNLRVLKLALAYKCIMLSSVSQIRNTGDRHDRRFAIFSDMYSQTMKGLTLYQDTNGDGEIDASTKAQPTHYIIYK
jgi:hypothetical protein